MDTQRIKNLFGKLKQMGSPSNWSVFPVPAVQITAIRNEISIVSTDISREYPHFSEELFKLKDMMFLYNCCFNPPIFGQVFAIFKSLVYDIDHPQTDIWSMIHSRIIKSSQKLFLDGHYANAAEDAFIEINDRVKRLYSIVKPGDPNVPDGSSAMTTVFSVKTPIIEFEDCATDTGYSTQNGFMQMLSGSMTALRNPKAHTNDIIVTKDECMRRLMFASMLMYKIDEAVKYSGINEQA